uniref:Uncharacterized protein n=1 Tax=Chromera velia CCMP2878 TaxID=1169474 RepID=A0A0K6S7J7_9ALVE|eukprot:Cvel_21344.t1-p1 / transcript=Cvel_21344.t1 / gene=Cvel_21344 / organism=Chromera_velia_CCMP2878 / gene_product=hypothetical protein / transcript_product=hypothetical protein / location=Cvel_scaffold1992:18324-21371(-) / protein_length=233 / sequence_SO=supercontig / SO=protein_coding / is_pseudo=false
MFIRRDRQAMLIDELLRPMHLEGNPFLPHHSDLLYAINELLPNKTFTDFWEHSGTEKLRTASKYHEGILSMFFRYNAKRIRCGADAHVQLHEETGEDVSEREVMTLLSFFLDLFKCICSMASTLKEASAPEKNIPKTWRAAAVILDKNDGFQFVKYLLSVVQAKTHTTATQTTKDLPVPQPLIPSLPKDDGSIAATSRNLLPAKKKKRGIPIQEELNNALDVLKRLARASLGV